MGGIKFKVKNISIVKYLQKKQKTKKYKHYLLSLVDICALRLAIAKFVSAFTEFSVAMKKMKILTVERIK